MVDYRDFAIELTEDMGFSDRGYASGGAEVDVTRRCQRHARS